MRHFPILLLAVAALCAEETPPAGQKPPKPNQEAAKASLEKAFTAGDADANGKLTRTEFAVAAESFHAAMQAAREKNGGDTAKKPAKPPAPADVLDKAFAAGDANADAGLDATEFAAAIKALRPPKGDKGEKGGKPEGEHAEHGDHNATPPPPAPKE